MPELPEVETVRRVLAPQLCGLTVEEAVTGRPEVIAYPAADEFRSRMAGRTVTANSSSSASTAASGPLCTCA